MIRLKRIKRENNQEIQGVTSFSYEEILSLVRNYIEYRLLECGIEDISILNIFLHGSRLRSQGKATSDLDVVVEYEGYIREDTLFNILNDTEDPLEIEGIRVDINPITKDKTGTLDYYITKDKEYINSFI